MPKISHHPTTNHQSKFLETFNEILLPFEGEIQNFRNELLQEMSELNLRGVNCFHCRGTCCLKSRNSMGVTLYEGVEVFKNLLLKFDISTLESKVQEAIQKFRLDHPIYIKNKLFRKTYDCPLFELNGVKTGCPLDKETKPFGCLAYNPRSSQIQDGEDCYLREDLLESTHQNIEKNIVQLNANIAAFTGFENTTYPLPILLYKLIQLQVQFELQFQVDCK